MTAPSVRCSGLVHVYGSAGQEVTALRGVDLEVAAGETIALLGPSGAGKSTLLWILAGLIRPTAGQVNAVGRDLRSLSTKESAEMRLREVGILLQNPGRNLLSYETALGNVVFAQRPTRRTPATKRRRAGALLEAVGLGSAAGRIAGSMSGGEQQRLGLAVALANGPKLLLADEPTSQLDHASASAVLDLLRAANEDLGTTVIAVTHDPAVSQAAGRTIAIRDGRVGAEGRAGEEFVVVGRDGTVQLPEDLMEVLPPGSLARAERTEHGVELTRVDPEHS